MEYILEAVGIEVQSDELVKFSYAIVGREGAEIFFKIEFDDPLRVGFADERIRVY